MAPLAWVPLPGHRVGDTSGLVLMGRNSICIAHGVPRSATVEPRFLYVFRIIKVLTFTSTVPVEAPFTNLREGVNSSVHAATKVV